MLKYHKDEMDWMLKHSSQKSTISVTYDFVSLHGLLFGIVKEKNFQFFSGWEAMPMDLEYK